LGTIDRQNKLGYLQQAIEIAKQAAAASSGLGVHSGEWLAEVIQQTYDKIIEIAEKA
jgi:hypothetical protein